MAMTKNTDVQPDDEEQKARYVGRGSRGHARQASHDVFNTQKLSQLPVHTESSPLGDDQAISLPSLKLGSRQNALSFSTWFDLPGAQPTTLK